MIRPGAIGDFILTLPAMESLKADFLEVWAASPNLPLARFATTVRSIASTGLDMLEFSPNPALIEELRSFDSIVSWYGANRPEFRELVRGLGLPFEFFTAIPPEDCRMHAADFFAAQVCRERGALAIPHIDCPSAARADFAVIHPFSGSPKKCWPLDRYRELADKLKIPVRWCAGPEEQLPGAVHIDDLYELACWLATARVYIGNDAGITHLAAAVRFRRLKTSAQAGMPVPRYSSGAPLFYRSAKLTRQCGIGIHACAFWQPWLSRPRRNVSPPLRATAHPATRQPGSTIPTA
jgi:ADP-heptose:LPS heptosyltransferase